MKRKPFAAFIEVFAHVFSRLTLTFPAPCAKIIRHRMQRQSARMEHSKGLFEKLSCFFKCQSTYHLNRKALYILLPNLTSSHALSLATLLIWLRRLLESKTAIGLHENVRNFPKDYITSQSFNPIRFFIQPFLKPGAHPKVHWRRI